MDTMFQFVFEALLVAVPFIQLLVTMQFMWMVIFNLDELVGRPLFVTEQDLPHFRAEIEAANKALNEVRKNDG